MSLPRKFLTGDHVKFFAIFCLQPLLLAQPVEWRSIPDGRFARVKPSIELNRLTLLDAKSTGVAFTNDLPAAVAAQNQVRLNGSGVALGDVDGDGWCDIYLCSLTSDNGLFRNLGNGRFTNIAAAAGVTCSGEFSSGAVFADVDGDD